MMLKITHPASTVQPVLHDANKLLVTELIVMIHIKNLEDGVDQVTSQFQACGHIHCPSKLICIRECRREWDINYLYWVSSKLHIFFYSPCPIERQAKLYICMAIAKSSKLLRNWKKDLNSSNVMPCSKKTRVKNRNLYIWDSQSDKQRSHQPGTFSSKEIRAWFHIIPNPISHPSKSALDRQMHWWTKKSKRWHIHKGIRRRVTHARRQMRVQISANGDTCDDERHESFKSTML